MSPADGSVPKSRILFVDDEQPVLDGLRRMLRSHRGKWDMTFESDPQRAAALVQEKPFEVIVSDMRMPQMSGVELLEKVRECSPTTVRIVLSGHAETSAIMKSVGPSHLYLSKPCAPEDLERAIGRACEMRSRLASPALAELVTSIDTLPSLPDVYCELIAAIDAEAPMASIGEIISRDMAMTAKLLKIVNSSYFGVSQELVDPARAAVLLGIEMIQSLVLGVKIFEQLESDKTDAPDFQSLWQHAARAAALSREICRMEGLDEVMTNQSCVAALLHDVGLLVLRTHSPDECQEVAALLEDPEMSCVDAERAVLGCTHGEVGAYLCALWGFPDPILEAIALHERPSLALAREISPLTVVHSAQALTAPVQPVALDSSALDLGYLEEVGVLERLPRWTERARAHDDSENDEA